GAVRRPNEGLGLGKGEGRGELRAATRRGRTVLLVRTTRTSRGQEARLVWRRPRVSDARCLRGADRRWRESRREPAVVHPTSSEKALRRCTGGGDGGAWSNHGHACQRRGQRARGSRDFGPSQ